MFGNVTALEGLHVIREIQELEYDARSLLLQPRQCCAQRLHASVRLYSATSMRCGYLGSEGIYGRKVMRTPMEIHLRL